MLFTSNEGVWLAIRRFSLMLDFVLRFIVVSQVTTMSLVIVFNWKEILKKTK